MPVYKNEKNNTWYVMARYEDWKGDQHQKCKRGFRSRNDNLLNAAEETLAILPPFSYNTGEVASSRNSTCF